MKYGFGVVIGSSVTKLAYFDLNGKLLHQWSIPTSVVGGSNQVLSDIADEIEQFMKKNQLFEDDILGVGVGIPGPVSKGGTVNKCVNLNWGVFNLDRALSGLTGLNVVSSNTANMAALGESWQGCAKGCKNMVFLSMKTGIGGAVISNGQLVSGAHGGGGEIGHFVVNRQETVSCTCGNKGCLEQYFSPQGIVRLTKRQLSGSIVRSSLRHKANLAYTDVVDAAQSGDKLAQEILEKVTNYAGEVLANICCVVNPDTIVLGGELCKQGSFLIGGLTQYFRKYVFHANKDVRFLTAALGDDAAVYGAFKLVLDTYGK